MAVVLARVIDDRTGAVLSEQRVMDLSGAFERFELMLLPDLPLGARIERRSVSLMADRLGGVVEVWVRLPVDAAGSGAGISG